MTKKHNVRNVKILGTGSYAPEKIYTNKDIEGFVDTNDSWIYDNLWYIDFTVEVLNYNCDSK